MKNVRILFVLFSTLLVVASCTKDTPVKPLSEQLVGTWKLSSLNFVLDSKSYPVSNAAFKEDLSNFVFIFEADKTFKSEVGGQPTGTWSVNETTNKLTVKSNEDGSEETYNISLAANNQLELSTDEYPVTANESDPGTGLAGIASYFLSDNAAIATIRQAKKVKMVLNFSK